VSLGPLAVVLLLPLVLVVGLRTQRWTYVVIAGVGAAVAALAFSTAAIVIVVVTLLSMIAGAVLLGTGVHAIGRPGRTLSVAELVVGSLAVHWWRRRPARRWADSWARRASQPKL
jgi:hypothetical protein